MSSNDGELDGDTEAITQPALATPTLDASPWPFGAMTSIAGSTASTSLSSRPFSRPASTSFQPNPSSLPHEILLVIFRLVTSSADLRNCILVCKSWCQCGVELLWHKPSFPTTSALIKMLVVLGKAQQTFPYALFVRRLNFSALADKMSDQILLRLVACERLERLTLAGCVNITDEAVIRMLEHCPSLVALDLSECRDITDSSVVVAANRCKRLQGLNLSGCKKVTDVGVDAIARGCKMLRRVCLSHHSDEAYTNPFILSASFSDQAP
jgi:F-box and leucine-rich repeat protein GRR1